jgi:transcriptional regulator with PAS, ATPase and Fis domain
LKKLVKRINDKLNLSVNNLRPRKYKTKKGKISVLYKIDWYSENALNIIRFLYDTLDSNDLYLERKFIKQKIAREIYKKVTKTNTIKNLKGKINMPIKLFLKKCLYEDKLKVSKIAEKLGVSPGTIYEWVKKFRIKLPPRKTVKICPICGKKFKKSNKKYWTKMVDLLLIIQGVR